MPEHVTHSRPLRVKLPRPDDHGHLIRGVGYSSECTCGWRSPRCRDYGAAAELGRMHVRAHQLGHVGQVIPPPATVPPPVSGALDTPTHERETAISGGPGET